MFLWKYDRVLSALFQGYSSLAWVNALASDAAIFSWELAQPTHGKHMNKPDFFQ